MSVEYMVSVRLMTYNHEKFIKEAMDGIMMQQTNFLVEVVVGDDFSPDKTLEIIKTYSDVDNIHIRVLDRPMGGRYYTERQKKGRLYNFQNIIANCSGKYVALLDGDDYWTDPQKLQKQVDFLESNQEYSICGHNHSIYRQDLGELDTSRSIKTNKTIELKDILNANCFVTATTLFRKSLIHYPDWFLKAPVGDWTSWIILLENKKGMILKDNMAVYRIHEGGVYGREFDKGSLLKKDLKVYDSLIELFPIYKEQLEKGKRYKIRIFRMYEYTLAALLKGRTPASEFFIEFGRILQIRTRLKKLIKR